MKNRYTNRDIDQFFIQFKSFPNSVELSGITQIINNPSSYIRIEGKLSNPLNMNFLFWTMGIISTVAIVFMYFNHTNKYLPDNNSNSVLVSDSSQIEDDDLNMKPYLDSNTTKEVQSDNKTVLKIKDKKLSSKSITALKHEREDKVENIVLLKKSDVVKSDTLSICNNFLTIDTTRNYFKVDEKIYEINSCKQFIDASWKHEWDAYYKKDLYLHLNFISEGKLNYGNYKISLEKINDMPFYSFYGALMIENKKHNFDKGNVRIDSVGSLSRVMFRLETVNRDIIVGYYKGKLKNPTTEE